MTEDQNDQTTGSRRSGPEPGDRLRPRCRESHRPAPSPCRPPTPEPPADGLRRCPQQPDTPPMGAAARPRRPAPPARPRPRAPYAMGALAGNPMLGDAAASDARPTPARRPTRTPRSGRPRRRRRLGGSTRPPRPQRPARRRGGARRPGRRRRHRPRRLEQRPATPSLSARLGRARTCPSGSGSRERDGQRLSNSPFGNGSPFGGSGNSGNSGNTGSGNSGSSNSSGPSDVNAIAVKVDPGLVDINTTLGYQQEQAAGTGIVLTSNGVILTNNHVIDGATSISVTDVGNHKTYTASVVGYDRTKDIAVLQLHNASGLQTATLGNSSNVSVGEDVVGVGNAGGTGGTPSAAGGTVTALNQSITASDEGDGTSEQLSGLIETNADIQPGDSGGALVNTSGQVLGVDTAASAGFSFQYNGQSSGNQGFAIPINTALSIARAIEAGNASSTVHIGETAFLGVEISPSGSAELGQQRQRWARRVRRRLRRQRGQHGQHRIAAVARGLGRRRRDQRPGPGGRPGPGRRDHLARRQDDRLGQRPHQRHGRPTTRATR